MRPITCAYQYASATTNVIVHGNSLSFGVGASSAAARWSSQVAGMQPLLAAGIIPNNVAVSGQTISVSGGNGNMTATAPTAVDANLAAGKTNILFCLEFTNELALNGVSASNAYTAWASYCAARKAAAAAAGRVLRIITMTCPPGKISGGYPAVNDVAFNNAVTTVNNMMRNNYRSYSDELCDIAALPVFAPIIDAGTFTQSEFQAAGVWNRSDGVANDFLHFGDSGYYLFASAAADALRRVQARL